MASKPTAGIAEYLCKEFVHSTLIPPVLFLVFSSAFSLPMIWALIPKFIEIVIAGKTELAELRIIFLIIMAGLSVYGMAGTTATLAACYQLIRATPSFCAMGVGRISWLILIMTSWLAGLGCAIYLIFINP
jgi:uncharacterized membrane protein